MTLPDWREIVPAGVVQASGTAVGYKTGAWRSQRPVVDEAKCTHCLFCWLFGPDGSVMTDEGRFAGLDLEHCKGCGICAVECPPKAISMTSEIQTLEGGVT